LKISTKWLLLNAQATLTSGGTGSDEATTTQNTSHTALNCGNALVWHQVGNLLRDEEGMIMLEPWICNDTP